MQVGVYLRQGELSEYERMKARVLAGKIELLEHAIEDQDDVEEVRSLALSADRALSRMRRAFLEQ